MTALFDPGLQPERTLLAWRRTCLAFCLGSAVAVRFTLATWGPLAAAVGAVGIGLALAAYLLVDRRYRGAQAGLLGAGRLTTGGLPLGVLALSAIALGVVAAGFVVLRVLGGEIG